MKKQLMTVLFLFALCICIFPLLAQNTDAADIIINKVELLSDGTLTGNSVSGVTVAYDAVSNTAVLTLNGANINTFYWFNGFKRGAGIYASGLSGLEIVLQGSNTIDVSWKNGGDNYMYGIWADQCPLVISGSGTLNCQVRNNINSAQYAVVGIIASSVTLTESVRVDINITGVENHQRRTRDAFGIQGNTTISDSSALTVNLDVVSHNAFGVKGNATMNGGSLDIAVACFGFYSDNYQTNPRVPAIHGISGDFNFNSGKASIQVDGQYSVDKPYQKPDYEYRDAPLKKVAGAVIAAGGAPSDYNNEDDQKSVWALEHTWNYSAEGNSIYAWCSHSMDCLYNGEENALKLTLTADNAPVELYINDAGRVLGAPYKGLSVNNAVTAVTGKAPDAVVYFGINDTNYSSSTTPPSELGSYHASITLNGHTAEDDFTITKRDFDYTAPTAKEVIHTGEPLTLVEPGKVNSQFSFKGQTITAGVMRYRIGENGEWITAQLGEYQYYASPQAAEVGEYDIYWQIIAYEHFDFGKYYNESPIYGPLKAEIIPRAVESVVIDCSSLELLAGETFQLAAAVSPENATYPDVTWSSSDPSIAEVDEESGLVLAKAAGTAVITAEADGKKASCTVTVKESRTVTAYNGDTVFRSFLTEADESMAPLDSPTENPTGQTDSIFVSWYEKDSDGSWKDAPYDFTAPVSEDLTLHALWSGTYAVNFAVVDHADSSLTAGAKAKIVRDAADDISFTSTDSYVTAELYPGCYSAAVTGCPEGYYDYFHDAPSIPFTLTPYGEITGWDGLGDADAKNLHLALSRRDAAVHVSGFDSEKLPSGGAFLVKDAGDSIVGEIRTYGEDSRTISGTLSRLAAGEYTICAEDAGIFADYETIGTISFTLGTYGSIETDGNASVNGNTVYLTLTKKRYTVDFDANGHGTTPAAQTVIHGETAQEPAVSEDGYTFGGWFVKENGIITDTMWDFSTVITAPLTLAAKWTIIPAAAPAVLAGPDLTLYYGDISAEDAVSVTAEAASDTAYTLHYQWYSKADGDSAGTAIENADNAAYPIPADTVPGIYTYFCVVTAERNDNGETADTTAPTVTVTVNKGIPDTDAPTAKEGLIYKAEAQDLINAGKAKPGHGIWEYKMHDEEDSAYSESIPAAADVGLYEIDCRFIPGTHYSGISPVTLVVLLHPAPQDAPDAPVMASRTAESITLETQEGCEYTRDGMEGWQDTCVFTGLMPERTYTFYARRKATATHAASEPGMGASFSTCIAEVPVDIPAPVKNAVPAETASVHPGTNCTAPGTIAWTPADAKFLGQTVYTAAFTLEPAAGYAFDDNIAVSVNGTAVPAQDIVRSGENLLVTFTFPATEARAVTAFTGILAAPASEQTYGDAFDPAGLTVSVDYDDGTSGQLAYGEETKALFAFDSHTVSNHPIGVRYAHDADPDSAYLPISGITVGKRAITVTAHRQDISYGETITNRADQVSADCLAEGDAITEITLTASTAAVTSNGTVTPSAAKILNGAGEDVTAYYDITYVNGKLTIGLVLDFIEVTEQPKLEYTSGDRLDLSGTVVTAYYTDGSSEVLSYTDVDFSPEHGTVLELRMDGTVITAAYGSKTTETDALTVHPKPFPQLDNWSLALMQLYSRKYVITASAGEGGSISPAGTAEVRYEQSAHYAITPCEGYVTADVLVDGVSVGAVSSYTFTSVKEHHTIEAVFKPVNPFTDLSEADACYDAAMYLYEKGIMIGMDLEKGIYGTHTGLSRAMIVTILWRMEGSPVVNYLMRFEDVQPEQWYTEAVRWAASEGIVKGYSDTRFGTADSLTREQMAVILYRYAQSEGYAVFAEGDLSSFEDAGKISAWAQDAMKWAVGNELLQIADDGALHPQDTATRAQAAIMLMWFFEWE